MSTTTVVTPHDDVGHYPLSKEAIVSRINSSIKNNYRRKKYIVRFSCEPKYFPGKKTLHEVVELFRSEGWNVSWKHKSSLQNTIFQTTDYVPHPKDTALGPGMFLVFILKR